MRKTLAVVAAAMLMGVFGYGQAQQGEPEPSPVTFLGGFLEQTRVVYPMRLGDWEAQGERRYEQREFGVSVRYMNKLEEGAWLDVYFYPAGVLAAEQLSRWAMQEFDDAIGARRNEGHHVQVVAPMDPFAINGAEHAFKGSMVVDSGTGPFGSAMGLAYFNLYFVKARLSRPLSAGGVEGVERLMDQALGALLPTLEIVSTGHCWQPYPVEEAPPGAVPDDTALVSMVQDDRTVWFDGERVLTSGAVTPEETLPIMMLAMAATGRIHPGCPAREPFEPVVPETHREIRLEYL